jgi:hypothetical protein
MPTKPTLEQIAHEVRVLYDEIPGMAQEHIQYRLREIYRWITGTDPWPETRR